MWLPDLPGLLAVGGHKASSMHKVRGTFRDVLLIIGVAAGDICHSTPGQSSNSIWSPATVLTQILQLCLC